LGKGKIGRGTAAPSGGKKREVIRFFRTRGACGRVGRRVPGGEGLGERLDTSSGEVPQKKQKALLRKRGVAETWVPVSEEV